MVTHKKCRRCKEVKPANLMKKDKRNKDGFSSFCKDCHKAASVQWQKENPKKLNSTRRIRYLRIKDKLNTQRKAKYKKEKQTLGERFYFRGIKYRYGVSKEWYLSTLANQGGGCLLCGKKPEESSKRFSVDHDHLCCPKTPTCGKCNRGILCNSCNILLHALAQDNVWFEKVINYLGYRKGNENGSI